jgi:hypothetical protein
VTTAAALDIPDDWRSWDDLGKDKLLARLRAEAIRKGKVETYCTDPTPSAMARRLMGERWKQRAYHEVLDQMAVDMLNGDLDRGTISLPPQVGKSTWVNWFVVWWQAHRPTEPIIRMSYSANLAVEHALSVQAAIEDHGAEWGLLPAPRSWKQDNWHTLTGSGLRSGGMLTGVSGFPAALMLIDDPFAGRHTADSKIIRDRTYNEYSGSLLARMRPGSPLLIVCTRWHDDDLVARVVKAEGAEADGGRWRVVNLPAIATEDADPLGRGIGDPLPHPWIPPDDLHAALRHWEDKRKGSTVRDWFSLYMGDPRPVEGALLSEDQVKAATWLGELPPAIKTGVAIDPSGGGRDTAGIVGGQLGEDGVLIWTHDRSGVMPTEEWAREACLLAHEIQANEFIVEHNYGGDAAMLILRRQWKVLQDEGLIPGDSMCPAIHMVHAKKGKRVRAEPIAAQVTFGMVKFWGIQVLNVGSEWQTWQEDSSVSPGRIDASSYLAYRFLKVPGSDAVVSTVREKRKESTGVSRTAARRIVR